MSLRLRAIIAVLAVAITLFGATYAISRVIFTKSYQAIEERNTRDVVQRASTALTARLEGMDVLNRDWAAWDDSYAFVQDPAAHQEFITSNMMDITFADTSLNVMLFVDSSGRIVYSKAYDLAGAREMELPAGFTDLVAGGTLTQHASADDGIAGVVMLPGGPILLSAQPITNSNADAPVAGTLFMGQLMDGAFLSQLGQAAQLPIDIVAVGTAEMTADFKLAEAALTPDNPVFTHALDGKTIAGYTLLTDLNGAPALMLRVQAPRDIYIQGANTMEYYLLSLHIMALVFALVFDIILGKLVLSRVKGIANFVGNIGVTGDLSQRLPVAGNDELGALAGDINTMVGALATSQHSLQARQQAEERLRLTVESVAEGIVTTDLAGTITQANDSATRLLGYQQPVELLGKSAIEFFTEEDQAKVRAFMQQRAENMSAEYRVLKRFNRGFWAEVSLAALQSDAGEPVGFVFGIRDVTERKNALASLQAQKELITRILATIPNAVLVIGADTKVVLANHAFYEQFRQQPELVEGRYIGEVVPVWELAYTILDAHLGVPFQPQLEFKCSLGGQEAILIASILRMAEDETLLILTDVTEEREQQQRLRITERLASVGEMASGVAHELNNPLTSVIGLSQLLITEDLPAGLKEDLKGIQSEAQRAAAVVKGLLTFAREHTPSKQPTQVNSVIQDVLKLRAYEQRINNIQVHTQLDATLPVITADYFQLQQVFLNIMLNAEQAMTETHQRGTLIITSERAENKIRVSFSDNGPGIAPENLPRIFNPFFTTKEVGKGTGLGLSICYGIVKNHGGNILARSEPGRGATFTVELPLDTSEEGKHDTANTVTSGTGCRG